MGISELPSPIRMFPSFSSSSFSSHLFDVGMQQSRNCVLPCKQVFLGTYTAKNAALGTKFELVVADSTALSRAGFECPPNGNMLEHQSTQVQKLKQEGIVNFFFFLFVERFLSSYYYKVITKFQVQVYYKVWNIKK